MTVDHIIILIGTYTMYCFVMIMLWQEVEIRHWVKITLIPFAILISIFLLPFYLLKIIFIKD